MRLDVYLFEKNSLRSRKAAQDLIHSGSVSVNGRICTKPAFDVSDGDNVILSGGLKYVSRGGLKLEKALCVFPVTPQGKTCIDVGASTGGFTDCMLQNGAVKVYSVDVGHGQLDKSLLNDERVVNCEGCNVKVFSETSGITSSFISIDVSFVSLRCILPFVKNICEEKSDIICLFKPQFEAGKYEGNKISNKKMQISLLNNFLTYVKSINLNINGLESSPIRGGDGNIEYLFWLSNYPVDKTCDVDVERVVAEARNGNTEVL